MKNFYLEMVYPSPQVGPGHLDVVCSRRIFWGKGKQSIGNLIVSLERMDNLDFIREGRGQDFMKKLLMALPMNCQVQILTDKRGRVEKEGRGFRVESVALADQNWEKIKKDIFHVFYEQFIERSHWIIQSRTVFCLRDVDFKSF